jgi:MFS family permease
MAFLGNRAVNRANLHFGIHAFAQGSGGIFLLVYLLKAGVSVPDTFLALAGILFARFVLRPLVLPVATRFGLKAAVMLGTVVIAFQYLALAEVQGAGAMLVAFCLIAALGDALYWPAYHAYFAAIGDEGYRGHQISARQAIAAVIGIAAPLFGGWALVTLGPHAAFGAVAAVQIAAAFPLAGAPNVTVAARADGAYRAAGLGFALVMLDGWLDGLYHFTWLVALFVTLGESFTAYGGAMALAALAGAIAGLALGRTIDKGNGARAVAIACAVAAGVIVLRAAALGTPWLAVAANALGALVLGLLVPAAMTAQYNLAKAAPCPLRFHVATESGWDLGCGSAALAAAAFAASGASLSLAILFALGAVVGLFVLLRRYYAAVRET